MDSFLYYVIAGFSVYAALTFLAMCALMGACWVKDTREARTTRHREAGELYICTRCDYVHKRTAPCHTPERKQS